MDLDFAKVLSQYGLLGIAVGALTYIVWKIGLRLIDAIDRLGHDVREHTKADNEQHGETREAVAQLREAHARIEGKIDATLDWQERTPVEHQVKGGRIPTPIRGQPSGRYGPSRPKTSPSDD